MVQTEQLVPLVLQVLLVQMVLMVQMVQMALTEQPVLRGPRVIPVRVGL